MLMRWPIVLIAAAAAGCTDTTPNNVSTNQAYAAANQAYPAGNGAADNYAASNSAGNASTYRGGGYRAFGTEPFWSVTIGDGRMRYEPADGTPVSEPLPARTPIPNGYRYVGAQMSVEVVHRTCQEAGEESYPDEVKVTVAGQRLQGCGGAPSGELG